MRILRHTTGENVKEICDLDDRSKALGRQKHESQIIFENNISPSHKQQY